MIDINGQMKSSNLQFIFVLPVCESVAVYDLLESAHVYYLSENRGRRIKNYAKSVPEGLPFGTPRFSISGLMDSKGVPFGTARINLF